MVADDLRKLPGRTRGPTEEIALVVLQNQKLVHESVTYIAKSKSEAEQDIA